MTLKIWLEIQRTSGTERRSVRPTQGLNAATVVGACPGCAASPFLIHGTPPELMADDRTLRSGARCVACGDAVGWCYARPSTLFGLEEDARVLGGMARVY